MRYTCVKLQRAQQRAWVPVLVARPFPSFCLQRAGALPSAQVLTPALGRARPRSARACPVPSLLRSGSASAQLLGSSSRDPRVPRKQGSQLPVAAYIALVGTEV